MKCPKCGHEQTGTVECAACGIVFAKYRQYLERQQQAEPLRPSLPDKDSTSYRKFILPMAAVGIVLIIITLFVVGGKDEAPAVAAKPAPPSTDREAVPEAVVISPYKELTASNLDHTLLRLKPELTQNFYDEFNYFWIRAYNCEYSREIQEDKSRFYEIMQREMDKELRYRYTFPDKYEAQVDVGVKWLGNNSTEAAVKSYINIRGNLWYGHAEQKGECQAVRGMNTKHYIHLKPFRPGLRIELPQAMIDQQKGLQSFSVAARIKLRIIDSKYEYRRSQENFLVRHQAVIEEMDFLEFDSEQREFVAFQRLNESQLY